ncbi:hypothetical protein HK103_005165 [Boothiomyces macroporosus]|uniref:MADS-box domain-containing protein n=1 Tax=Boothiomyces macroporosus TaxID=261099 RepID=A0AAD5Y7N5_9FUNG|nr:hypothetical protein HK103_005165 [Boothiomyces macroporosus]
MNQAMNLAGYGEQYGVRDDLLKAEEFNRTGTPGLDIENYGGEEEDDDDEKPAKKAGRRKIKIEYIEDKSRRHITFSKRKAGIMKKAYELSTLTGTQVLLLVASETGHVYTFATPKLQPLITKPEGKNMIQTCLNATDAQASTALPNPVPGYGATYQPTPIHSPAPRPMSAMSMPYSENMGSPNQRQNLPDNEDSLLLPSYNQMPTSNNYSNTYNSAGLPLSPPTGYMYPNNYNISQNPQYNHLVQNNGRQSPQLPQNVMQNDVMRTASPAQMMMRTSTPMNDDMYELKTENRQ